MRNDRTCQNVRALLLAVGAALATTTAAFAQPANDECASATVVTAPSSTSGDSTGATGTDISSCAFEDALDVWYSFTAAAAGTFVFDTEGSATADTTLSLWSDCGVTELLCDDDSGTGFLSRISYAMSAGQTVYVRYAGYNGASGPYVLNINPPAVAPGNDECAAAVPVLPGSSTPGTTSGATGTDITSCTFQDANDVWYRLNTTSAGFYLIDTIGTGLDTSVSVFTACGGTELACNDDIPGQGVGASQVNVNLGAASSYWIRVAGYNGAQGAFNLNVGNPVAPPNAPANDLCSSATVITGLPFADTTTDISGAGDDADLASCNAAAATVTPQGVWYSYTPAANQRLRVTENSALNDFFAVFSNSGGCGGTFTEVACGFDAIFDVTAGTTYYILLGAAGTAGLAPPAVIDLSVIEVIPPANDFCSAPQVITAVPSSVSGSNLGGTSDVAESTCSFGDDVDVWYSYTAGSSFRLQIDTEGSVDLDDTSLSIYDTCGGTELACDDDAGTGFLSRLRYDVTSGSTYLIRVAGYGGAMGAFTLNLSVAPPPAANDTCAGATVVSGTLTVDQDNSEALNENAEPAGSCNVAGATGVDNSIWFTFTPGANGQLAGSVDSAIAFYDIIGVLYTGSCGSLTEVACYDTEPFDLGFDENLNPVNLTAGTQYYLVIGDWGVADGGGDTQITITVPGGGPVDGACCNGTICSVTSAGACTGANTLYSGNGTVCNVPGNYTTPCCKADYNHVGGVTVQDIFDFLNGYFNASAPADINGGGVTVQDIFDFLSAYFAGCA